VNSIRRRLTLSLLIGFCLLWAVGGNILYLVIRTGLIKEFDSSLQATAEGLSAATEQQKQVVHVDLAVDVMSGFRRDRLPDYFQARLADGTTITRSPSLKDADLPDRVTPSGKGFACWNLVLPDGREGRAIGIQFMPQLEEEVRDQPDALKIKDPVTLVVARHRAMLDHQLGFAAAAILLVGAVLAVATVIGVPLIVGRGLRPLDTLAGRAASIDAKSLQLRFPTDGLPVELRPICQQLNGLLARLQLSFEREQRFSADVAHELRTPIAELRTLSEVALKWPEDSQAARHAFQDALAIALEMESIATGLLGIARCEGGLVSVCAEPVLLAPLIDEIADTFSAKAKTRQITFSVVASVDRHWLTDPTLLRGILINLLSNALQYSPAGSHVRVSALADGEIGRVLVSNPTSDLMAEDLPHLFERFWQKDPSRSSTEHSGLGLALSQAYARALGLDLRAELSGTGTITFVLSGAQLQ